MLLPRPVRNVRFSLSTTRRLLGNVLISPKTLKTREQKRLCGTSTIRRLGK